MTREDTIINGMLLGMHWNVGWEGYIGFISARGRREFEQLAKQAITEFKNRNGFINLDTIPENTAYALGIEIGLAIQDDPNSAVKAPKAIDRFNWWVAIAPPLVATGMWSAGGVTLLPALAIAFARNIACVVIDNVTVLSNFFKKNLPGVHDFLHLDKGFRFTDLTANKIARMIEDTPIGRAVVLMNDFDILDRLGRLPVKRLAELERLDKLEPAARYNCLASILRSNPDISLPNLLQNSRVEIDDVRSQLTSRINTLFSTRKSALELAYKQLQEAGILTAAGVGITLPKELESHVVGFLKMDDVANLARTCKVAAQNVAANRPSANERGGWRERVQLLKAATRAAEM